MVASHTIGLIQSPARLSPTPPAATAASATSLVTVPTCIPNDTSSGDTALMVDDHQWEGGRWQATRRDGLMWISNGPMWIMDLKINLSYVALGYGGDLSSYLDSSRRNDLVAGLSASEERARKAIEAENAGNHREAIRLWGITFGRGFPAYG
jgi:hypothetical protein